MIVLSITSELFDWVCNDFSTSCSINTTNFGDITIGKSGNFDN